MINRIVVDIGNSRITCGIFVDKKIVDLSHYLVANDKSAAQDIIRRADAMKIQQIALCSVVPSAAVTLKDAFRATEHDVFEVTEQAQTIISGTYDSLGADRIANIAAAIRMHVRTHSAIVIDMGSATTLTAADSTGKFLGGLIALGLGKTVQALYHGTAQLPEVDVFNHGQAAIPLAFDTDNSIVSGTMSGHVGMIEHWIKSAKQELGSKATVIATGGYAARIAPYTKVFDHVDPYLTLHGINIIAEDSLRRST